MNAKKDRFIHYGLWITGILILIGTVGCGTTVVRENILSSIDTGIGATLAENKQTQLYEFKAGYIRNQFYSIPTGKIVENTNELAFGRCCKKGQETQITNAANLTPQVVSGIRSHTGLQDILLGMDVSENFAVGDKAVASRAAVAMYISTATDPKNADAAQKSVAHMSGLGALSPDSLYSPIEAVNGAYAFLTSVQDNTNFPEAKKLVQDLDSIDTSVANWDFSRYSWQTDGIVLSIEDSASAVPNKGYERFKQYWGGLQLSVKTLGEAKIVTSLRRDITVSINDQAIPPALPVLTAAQKQAIVEQSDAQANKLKKLNHDFENDPRVINALNYFGKIIQK